MIREESETEYTYSSDYSDDHIIQYDILSPTECEEHRQRHRHLKSKTYNIRGQIIKITKISDTELPPQPKPQRPAAPKVTQAPEEQADDEQEPPAQTFTPVPFPVPQINVPPKIEFTEEPIANPYRGGKGKAWDDVFTALYQLRPAELTDWLRLHNVAKVPLPYDENQKAEVVVWKLKNLMAYADSGNQLRSIWAGCYHDPRYPRIRWLNLNRIKEHLGLNKNLTRQAVKDAGFKRLYAARMPTVDLDTDLVNYGLDNWGWGAYSL